MLKIAIVDDEENVAQLIERTTIEHAEQLGLSIETKVFYSGKQFCDTYHPQDFDVAFLDIQMPEMDGDLLSAKLSELDPRLLFVYVTSLCNGEVYTMLKYMPIGFLRKPFFEAEIDEMLRVLEQKVRSMQKTYTITTGTKVWQIPLQDVVYVESNRNYVLFHMQAGEPIRCRMKLDVLERDIMQYGFIRIHSSYLINCQFVYLIETNQVRLCDQKTLPISKSYRETVKRQFLHHARRAHTNDQ